MSNKRPVLLILIYTNKDYMNCINKILYVMAIGLLLIVTSCKTDSKADDEFILHRGINISHWLSQNNARGEARATFFTEKDVAYIASEGFDHLRIPIDEEQMFTEDGKKDAEAFALLHKALEWCRKYNLRAVVDLHILRSHYFNAKVKPLFTDEKAQETFYECWRQISSELHTYSNGWVAYELLNEPVADKAEEWNRLVKRCVETIRELEPERTLVIGSNLWQGYQTVKDLQLPANDKNIIISFHYYLPFLFTHYRASWTPESEYTGAVHYPGNVVHPEDLDTIPTEIARKYEHWTHEIYNKDVFAQNCDEVLQVAKSHGLKVYCGEYGCIDTAPVLDRLKWWRDINEVFEQKGIARAVWEYKGEFGIIKKGVPDREMINALMGTKSKTNNNN